MSAWGFDDGDFKQDDEVMIYPDCWPVVMLMMDMATQWRTSMGGIIGLDYNVLPMLFSMRGVADADRAVMLDDLQVMECEALHLFNEDSKDG